MDWRKPVRCSAHKWKLDGCAGLQYMFFSGCNRPYSYSTRCARVEISKESIFPVLLIYIWIIYVKKIFTMCFPRHPSLWTSRFVARLGVFDPKWNHHGLCAVVKHTPFLRSRNGFSRKLLDFLEQPFFLDTHFLRFGKVAYWNWNLAPQTDQAMEIPDSPEVESKWYRAPQKLCL